MKWASGENIGRDNRKLTYFVLNGKKTVPTTEFDVALGTYTLVTALSAIAYIWLELGKLLAVIAILHNSSELVLLVIMHYGGRITSNKFHGILILYTVAMAGMSTFLNWPFDALWFKLQGSIYLFEYETYIKIAIQIIT